MKTIVEIPVDIANEFTYNSNTYRISEKLEQYLVSNYPIVTNDKYNDWTNSCDMDSVIVIEYDDTIKFLDQKGKDITDYIKQI